MKHFFYYCTLLFIVFYAPNAFAQSSIKKAYKKALKEKTSYFECNGIEEDLNDLKKFMKKNPGLKCKYELGPEVFAYGEAMTPVVRARFLIEPIRKAELDEFVNSAISEGFVQKTSGNKTYLVKVGGDITYRNIDDLFDDGVRDYNYNFARKNKLIIVFYDITSPFELKPFSKELHELSSSTYVQDRMVTKPFYFRKLIWGEEDKNSPFILIREQEQKDRAKALFGDLSNCLDYYSKYGGTTYGPSFYTSGKDTDGWQYTEYLPKEYLERLKSFLFTTDKLDEKSEKIRNTIYEKAYSIAKSKINDVDWVKIDHIPIPFFSELTNPFSFVVQYANKYDPKGYAEDIALSLIESGYKQVSFKPGSTSSLFKFRWRYNIYALAGVCDFIEMTLKRFKNTLSSEKKDELFDKLKYLMEFAENERNIYNKEIDRQIQSDCDNCIIDYAKTIYPKEEEVGLFIRSTTVRDGEIVMKNGDKYYWTIKKDKWAITGSSNSLILTESYDTFNEMLEALVKHCRKKYCR